MTKRGYITTASKSFLSTSERPERAAKQKIIRIPIKQAAPPARKQSPLNFTIERDGKVAPKFPRQNSLEFRQRGPRRSEQGDALREAGPAKFRVRGARVLQLLRELLETTKLQKEEATLMQALDPDGKQWPIFEERMYKVFEGETQSSPILQKLHKDLARVLAQHSYPEAGKRRLHFAFIDQVVASQEDSIHTQKRDNASDLRYPTEWYASARALQRDIHLHVGPTNSGKTYNALKRLEESGNGLYAGPLRLLAHEVYSRFKAKNIPVDLVTGDDVRRDDSADVKITSSTVEMIDVGRAVDVAVIDEIQMMADADRGWAWTRAVLGTNAKELHLCGEARTVPLLKELAASMGDKLHIHQYERLNPLKAMSKSLNGNLKSLRKGDCIVSFTILRIHALKKEIEIETGRRVAIVYGGLPPETRAQQAALFNEPDNDYDFLVASDAIGMGLNLSIKRIIFEEVSKFNGNFREQLSVPQIKQIAGRAGRYRTSRDQTHSSNAAGQASSQQREKPVTSVGLVTCMQEDDLPILQKALSVEAPPLHAAGLLPPIEIVEEYAARLPKGVPFTYVYERLCTAATLNPRFKMCEIDQNQDLAKAIDFIEPLSIAHRCIFAAAPLSIRTTEDRDTLRALATCVAERKSVTVVDIQEIPLEVLELPLSPHREYLASLEALHKSLILYLWLSYRYLDIFRDRPMAFHAKELVEEKINTCLLAFSANPKLRKEIMRRRNYDLSKPPSPSAPESEAVDELAEPGLTKRELDDSPPVPIDWTRKGDVADLTDIQRVSGEPQYVAAHG